MVALGTLPLLGIGCGRETEVGSEQADQDEIENAQEGAESHENSKALLRECFGFLSG